jgi:hypothetical protein
MSLFIQKDAVGRLTNKFGLVPTQGIMPQLALDGRLMPVTILDDLFSEIKVLPVVGISVTSTGLKSIAQVPGGKRWRIFAMDAGLQSGTFTVDRFVAFHPDGTYIPVKILTAATDINYLLPDGTFDLPSSWQIKVNISTKAVNGTMYGDIFYQETNVG